MSSLATFIKKTGIFSLDSLVGYAMAFREQETSEDKEYPGFPFLINQEYLIFPGSDDRFYPSNEVSRDNTYVYYETISSSTDSFHFSELIAELKEHCREHGF